MKKPKLFYFPLEPYIERYTWFLSSEDGWFETNARNAGYDVYRIEGKHATGTIRKGAVLDYVGRSRWAMSQVDYFLQLMDSGHVEDGDMLYVEDFWHAGIEAIFYARQFGGPNIRIGTFIHAQSIDDSDFMWDAREWARGIEIGFSHGYDMVFTTSPILQALAKDSGYNPNNIVVTGLPLNSKRLTEQLTDLGLFKEPFGKREGVLFSSRFDKEKNPHFYMTLAEKLHEEMPFKLVAPRSIDKLSNDPTAIERLKRLVDEGKIQLIDTSCKKTGKLAYYRALSEASVQFNCAEQDWTSWTLLEACLFGAFPVYPKWKDFPRELDNNEDHLYVHKDIDDACRALRSASSKEASSSLMTEVVARHDRSTEKALNHLNAVKR